MKADEYELLARLWGQAWRNRLDTQAAMTSGDKKGELMADPMTSGVSIRLEIRIDRDSVPNDVAALGACLGDLEREGWFLDAFSRLNDGGLAAVMLRTWRIGVPARGMAKLAATLGTDAKEPA